MKKDDELHLTCSCHSHELHFEKDQEMNMWYISFWQRGYVSETSWKYRIKCVWHILRHGRPYGDEVILNEEDMKVLHSYVKNQIRKD